jgi:sec-independent protein translocase protein TatA
MLSHTLAIAMPGMFEWIIIGALGLLIFGKRLPTVGKGLGEGIRNFRLGLKEGEAEAEATDHKAIADK